MKPYLLLLCCAGICGCSMDESLHNASATTSKVAHNVGNTVKKGARQGSKMFNQAVTWVKQKASPEQKRVASSRGKHAADKYRSSGKPAPRYLAVDTPANEGSNGAKTVMIYDTKSGEVLGKNAFDVDRKPSAGETLSLDGVNAEYVGK